MASGLIYVAIVGMWVAYFLPRWVHDRNEFSGKSVERYKSALRVVANSSPASNGTGVVFTDLDQEAKVAQRLMRRRIIFSLLIFSLASTVVGGVMNSLKLIYALVPLSGLVIYIAHVRRQTITEKIQKRRITELQKRTTGVAHTNLSDVLAPRPQTSSTNKEHWVPLSERELSGVVILPKGSAELRNSWQPNEVPVPTYVNAPKAVVPKRTIDLTTPGQWSDEQERLAREALAAASPSRDEVFDQQLADEAVERLRHASNE